MMDILMQRLQQKQTVILMVIITCVVVVSTSGCDALLDPSTEGVLTTDSFYETAEDLNAALTAVWEPLNDGRAFSWGGSTMVAPFMGSDDLTTRPGSNKIQWREADQFRVTATNRFLYRTSWQVPYDALNRANTLLAKIDASSAPEAVKTEVAAQARFLRGWIAFWLVRLYGPIPFTTNPDPNYEAERVPVPQVYEQIVSDLTFAEENLPPAWSAVGRPTRWAAKAMLARVYLTMAGWPLNDQSNYSLARDKYREVMESGQFRLLEDFSALWQLENRFNDEHVFVLPFCRECDVSAAVTGRPTTPPEEGGFADIFAEVSFFEDMPEGPRKEGTFHTVFADTIHWTDSQLEHPFFQKWRSGTAIGGDGPHPVKSSRLVPFIRYPHVLLGFAEAQAMADGAPSTAAYEAVNQVRDRAGLPDLTSGLSQMAFRDSVMAERGWEFAGEFTTRWFDLIRTEKVAEANADKAPQDIKPVRDIQSLPKEHFYYMPIPQQEIELNPNLTQNPGY